MIDTIAEFDWFEKIMPAVAYVVMRLPFQCVIIKNTLQNMALCIFRGHAKVC